MAVCISSNNLSRWPWDGHLSWLAKLIASERQERERERKTEREKVGSTLLTVDSPKAVVSRSLVLNGFMGVTTTATHSMKLVVQLVFVS